MMNRVLSFAGKARRRGLDYVGAVSSYQAHSMRYRVLALSRREEKTVNQAAEMVAPPNPTFHFALNDVPAIVGTIPESAKLAAVLQADQCLAHRFSFRGLEAVHFPRHIDWDFSPDGNLSWSWTQPPSVFLTLGTTYHYTQSAVYLDKLVELWQDWMQRNPAGKGLNWRSPFELQRVCEIGSGHTSSCLLRLKPVRHSSNCVGRNCRACGILADHLEYHWPTITLLER